MGITLKNVHTTFFSPTCKHLLTFIRGLHNAENFKGDILLLLFFKIKFYTPLPVKIKYPYDIMFN